MCVEKSNKADKIISGDIFHKNVISTFMKSTEFSKASAFISDPPPPHQHLGECSFLETVLGGVLQIVSPPFLGLKVCPH
jgi:hypothetical protein